MSRTSLAWLLQPLSVPTFLDDVWGVTHYHVERSLSGYFDALLHGPSAADELLERVRPEPSAVRLVRGGATEAADAYRCPDGSLDVARVRDAFAEGYTIVLNGLEQYVRAIASLSHSVEVELNFPTRVNAYLTPPESTGFEPHYDPHDVLVLQLHGAKVWRLSEDAAVPPHEIQRRQGVAGDIPLPSELRLEAGDTLYLPRGRVHAAETASEPSVHLTVGIHAPTVLSLFTHALHSLSLRDDRLHARLPPRHLDDPAVRARLGGLVRDIVEDPSVVAGGLDAMEEVLARRGRCPPVGRISDSVALGGDTVVAKYQPLYSRVVATGDGAALQFAQLSINVGAEFTAAMLFVSKSAEPFRVRDLPGLTATQQTELARTLIAAGFLVRLPAD